MPITAIAKQLSAPFSVVYGIIRKEYPEEYQKERKRRCYRNSKLGSKNPQYGKFKKDKVEVSDGKGYVLILKPDWYTGRKRSRHTFLHHLVVCEHLKMTEIPKGYCVHHKDRNPLNNSIENLELMTLSAHMTLHQREKR